jgi:diadenosine tetraphosphatase ApaH/serine/threonine PP2A family protein phosphatase
MCDIMWSDPTETHKGWNVSNRGAGFLFGQDVLDKFLHTNKLSLLT